MLKGLDQNSMTEGRKIAILRANIPSKITVKIKKNDKIFA
jgi:hypothetical protein